MSQAQTPSSPSGVPYQRVAYCTSCPQRVSPDVPLTNSSNLETPGVSTSQKYHLAIPWLKVYSTYNQQLRSEVAVQNG
jgi:hypothetical protein